MNMGLRRTRVIASLATIAALAFLFSVTALVPSLVNTVGGNEPGDDGATFTFTSYRCLGEANDARSCRWFGTVTSGGNVEATEVEYRDEAPEGVTEGTQVSALWSFRDPYSAWDIQSARAWLSTIASAVLSSLMFLVFTLVAVVWWRRSLRESKASKESAASRSKGDHPERAQTR